MDINAKLNEIENEIKLLREQHNKYNEEVLVLEDSTRHLSVEYEYPNLFDVSGSEFINLYLSEFETGDAISISLNLQEAIELSSHLTKLINKYALYREEIRENC